MSTRRWAGDAVLDLLAKAEVAVATQHAHVWTANARALPQREQQRIVVEEPTLL